MIKDLSKEYLIALKSFLEGGGESALKSGYSLGRQALEQGIGVLDLATAHHQALVTLPHRTRVIKQAGEFLAECLSPFEMAQRGYRESIAALNFLNDMLESEVEKRTQEMRVTEERYRTLIQISPDALVLTDLDGRIILCNQQYARQRGHSAPEDLVNSLSDYFVAPEDLPRIRELRKRVLKDGIIGELEFTLVRKDGVSIPAEARVTIIPDADGMPAGFVGVSRDISERKREQSKLEMQAKSRAAVALLGLRALSGIDIDLLMQETVNVVTYAINVEFCELLELLPDGKNLILRHGLGWKDGEIGSAGIKTGADSQAGFTLLSAEPVIVENLATEERFHPSELLLEHGIHASMTVIIHGKNQPYGVLGAHTATERRFTLDDAHLLQSIANVLAMAIDNRRLLETESQARQLAERNNEQRLKSLAIISHELRTPLTSIKGFASTLLADDVTWNATSQRDFILTINEEADKLSNLIAQVLDLSKLEAGALKFYPVQQYPTQLLDAAMPHLQTLTHHHNLIVRIPDNLPDVLADAQYIGQVLDNLVENAAKYAPEGTTILIAARRDDGFIRLSIADEGPGIPPQEREMIFQPFYRSQDKNILSAKGAGLGLAICRRLVEAHGGRIWVDENEKPGTMISFTLPLAGALEQENGRL